MKKYFYSLFAATAMLLATASCSQDELEGAAQGNEVDVTFTLKQEGNTATRAIGDGTTAKYLYFGAYLDDQYVETLQPEGYTKDTHVEFDDNLTATVKLRLVKGQTYKFLFWAQSTQDEKYYNVDFGSKQVNVKYGKNDAGQNVIAANDENRDAFWHATGDITITGPLTETIVLKRPFAQVNVGIAEGELAKAKAAGVDVATSSFYFNEVATTLSVFDGKVSNPQAVLYEAAAIPAEATPAEVLTLDVDKDGVKEEYEYIAMNYILVNDATKEDASGQYVMGDASFAIQTAEKSIKEYKVPNLRVQRNYRTNIIASIMADAEFKIVIDPIFDGDINYPSKGEQELRFAAVNGGEVTLTKDVELTAPLEVTSSLVIDLNGYTIEGTSDISNQGVLSVGGKGRLTVKDSSAEGKGAVTAVGAYPIATVGDEAVANLYGGNFTATNSTQAAYARRGTINVYGGYYEVDGTYNGTSYVKDGLNPYTLNCYDLACPQNSRYTNGTDGNAAINVYGGEFNKFNPANNPEGEGTTYVAEGYTVYQNGESWFVTEGGFANSLESLKAALANGGEVTLTENIEADDFLYVAKETVLNLNGKTISLADGENVDAVIVVNRGGTLTIEGEGNITGKTSAIKLTTAKDEGTSAAKLVVNGGKLTGNLYGIAGNGGRHNTDVVINGGEIVATNGTAIFQPQDGKLTIKGGKMTGLHAGVEVRAGSLTIEGGEFASTFTDNFTTKKNGSGSTILGAAVGVSQHSTNKDINVKISGGTFTGEYAFYEEDLMDEVSNNITVEITGGTFNGKVYTENGVKNNITATVTTADVLTNCLANGYKVVLAEDITVADAIEAANVEIDGNGHTLTSKILKTTGDVKLSNVTLANDGENYVFYNQGGKVEMTGVTCNSTKIFAINLYGGGEAILKDCNFTGNIEAKVYSHANVWVGDGRKVTVDGGTYGSIFVNASNGAGSLNAGTITLNSGTINKLTLETELNTEKTGYMSAVLIQNGGTINTLVTNPQGYDLTGLTKLD